jgi:hypothetical protein
LWEDVDVGNSKDLQHVPSGDRTVLAVRRTMKQCVVIHRFVPTHRQTASSHFLKYLTSSDVFKRGGSDLRPVVD